MLNEIAVIGYPSYCGGADTELLDQLRVWNMMGIRVHLIPTKDNKEERIDLSDYNVEIHDYMDFKSCSGLHTLSFCNPAFLNFGREIKKYAKSTSWANCMTFNFKNELEAHENGYIDYFLYQTKHQYNNLAGNLLKINRNYIPYQFIPYFDDSRFPFIENRDYTLLRFGRISRCDAAKYSIDQFKIYKRCHRKKSGTILGWSDELIKLCKFNKTDIDKSNCMFYREGEISQQEFYKRCNVLCMSTRTFENLPRVGFEAMSSGTVLVVNNRGGWKLQVDNGKTGYLCNNTQEFIKVMNFLGDNQQDLKKLAMNAKTKLNSEFSLKKSASSWAAFFNGIEKRS